MKKILSITLATAFILLTFTSCGVGDKTASLSVIYAAAAVLSYITMIIYCCIMKKKDMWFLLMFSMISVVNTGYFVLSISGTLEEALLANRISYLGSVFLPLAMLFIILDTCRYKYRSYLPVILALISIFVFLVAASPGYLDIYYKEVTLGHANGVTVLEKVYGPWHNLYLLYLVAYFSAMIASICYATARKKIPSGRQATVIATAVLVNLGVWFIEQLVKIEFEFLSVSYIISELFLLSLYFIINDGSSPASFTASEHPDTLPSSVPVQKISETVTDSRQPDEAFLIRCEHFRKQLTTLTPTEQAVYGLYLEGKSTKEIMQTLNIKENTVKYHNKNIYSKLGVSSRRQMLELADAIRQ